MKCKHCNTELKQGAKFCPNCGREVSGFDVCISCGQQIKVGASFCPHCGANQKENINPTQQQEITKISDSPTIDVLEQNEKTIDVDNAVPEQHEKVSHVEAHEDVENTLSFDGQNNGSKKWFWTIVAVLLLGIIGGGYYYLSQNKGSSSGLAEAVDTESIAVVEPTGMADEESLKKDVSTILSSVLSPSFELEDIHKYFTEGYTNFYKRACDKAEKEGCEYPKMWWQESDSDPESYKINQIITKSDNETIGKVTISSELYSAPFDVTLKKENGKWLIDAIAQVEAVTYNNHQDNAENTTTGNGTYLMAGKVSKYAIHMKIEIDGSEANGYYYYDSQGSGNIVKLSGSITESGELTLKKFSNDGEETGYFEGLFNGVEYNGKNVNYNRDEDLQFSVTVE